MKALSLILIFLVSLTFVIQSCTKEEEVIVVYEQPIAGFTLKQNNETIMFTNTSTKWTSCTWYFGDGDSAVDVTNPTHTYDSSGTYSVTLLVRNEHLFDQTTEDITINIIEIVPPTVSLSNAPTWSSQNIEVSGLTYQNNKLVGDFFLELSYSEDFSQPSKAIFFPKTLPSQKNFEFDVKVNNEPSGELNGLKPGTQYFLRGRYLQDAEPVFYTDVVTFTTENLPLIELNVYADPVTNTGIVSTTQFSDINNLISEEILFFSDPERTKKITPWNWDSESQSFLPHLGEVIYVTYLVTYNYHNTVISELYAHLEFPYIFASGSTKTKNYKIEKFGQKFKIELTAKHLGSSSLKKVVLNCVKGSKNSSLFSMNAQEANEEENYLQVTFLSSIYYPIQEKNYELIESDFTKGKNLGFRYFALNAEIAELRIVNGTYLYTMARPLIRIDD